MQRIGMFIRECGLGFQIWMIIVLILVLSMVWSAASHATGIVASCPTTVDVKQVCATAGEPTTYVDGVTPIIDYQKTRFYITQDGVIQPPIDVQATKATGGGSVSISIDTKACAKSTYTIAASGFDTTGESAKTQAITVVKDRTAECSQVPAAPSSFTVR